MTAIFHVPTSIHFGPGALDALTPPPGRVLLLASPSLPTGTVETLAARLRTVGCVVLLLKKPAGEPLSAEVDRVFAGLPPDLAAVAAIGGGSVLDFAKALALLAASGGAIADYEFGQRRIEQVLPLFLAPTTCGSGSEVTPYAAINNSVSGRKFTLGHPALRPAQAAIDPALLRALPPDARQATALDAFIHCLEARLNRADCRLIAPLAEAGLELGWRLLPQADAPVAGDELLMELALLSLYGGLSIAHSRTGLIHTLSVAFANFCDQPHGLLNARLLPHALAHNLPGYGGLLAQVIGRCSGTTAADDAAALHLLTDWLAGLIGRQSPAPATEIRARRGALVARLLQDGGLPGVSHGLIIEAALTALIERIADAAG